VLLKNMNKWWYLMFIWALLVSVSRVYLGVHYPLDIFIGAMYGAVIGYMTIRLTLKIVENT